MVNCIIVMLIGLFGGFIAGLDVGAHDAKKQIDDILNRHGEDIVNKRQPIAFDDTQEVVECKAEARVPMYYTTRPEMYGKVEACDRALVEAKKELLEQAYRNVEVEQHYDPVLQIWFYHMRLRVLTKRNQG